VAHSKPHFRMIWLLAAAIAIGSCTPGGATIAPAHLEPTPRPVTSESPGLPPTPRASIPASDVIFHNAVILTMDDALPTASAIHIVGDSIASVGEDSAILAEAGPQTRIVDLGGLTLMPGFIDSHAHLFHVASSFGKDDRTAQEEALRFGITSIGELWSDETLVRHLQELDAAGGLRLRTSIYLAPFVDGCGNIYEQDWYRAFAPGADLGSRLRVGGIKLYTDGGSCNAPAVSFEYPAGAGHGDLYFSQSELNQIVTDFHRQGYQLAIHAIGDRGIDQALEAIAAAQAAEPREVRHRIEHAAVIRPDQMPRFDTESVVAVMFGSYPTCSLLQRDGSFQYYTPDDYLTWEWPMRSLLENAPQGHYAYHSDAYGVRPLNPFENLYGLVTRQEVAEDGTICRPPAALAAGAVTVDQALRAMTLEGAYALGQEDDLGSLAPGKLADLIVLSADPTRVTPDGLRDLQVRMTMLGGGVVYCAPGYEAICPPAAALPSPQPSPQTPLIFRDEFDGSLDPGWSWTNEAPAAWSLTATPGWLRIALSQGGFLTTTPSNVLLRPAPPGDFDLTTTLRASPSRNFEFAGLIVTFADGRVLQFGRAYCDVPGVCTGGGYYFDNLKGGATTGSNFALPGFAGSQYVLRLEKRGTTYTAYYLTVDGQPVAAGSHTVAGDPQSVGLLAAQAPAPGPVAEFDFFEIKAP